MCVARETILTRRKSEDKAASAKMGSGISGQEQGCHLAGVVDARELIATRVG